MMGPLDRVELRRMAEAVTRAEVEHGVFIRRSYTLPIVTLLDDLEAAGARIAELRTELVEIANMAIYRDVVWCQSLATEALLIDDEAAK